MPAVWAAGIGAAAGVIGDIFSSSGTQDTNAANSAMNQANINAAMERQTQQEDFNAQQAQLGRQYNTNMTVQAQNYNTQMSDTAMQRRMADLRAAGVNPLLALGTPGATATPVQAPNAPTASAGTAGQGSSIPMQNPGAAYGNLGGIMNSATEAAKTAREIDLARAQTDNLDAKTGTEVPAQVAYLQALTGTTKTQAEQMKANIGLMEQQANEAGQGAELKGAQMNLTMVQQQLASADLQVKQGTINALISGATSDAEAKKLGLVALNQWAKANEGKLGEWIAQAKAIMDPVSSAVKAGTMMGVAAVP